MAVLHLDKSGRGCYEFGLVIVDDDDGIGPHLHLVEEKIGRQGDCFLTLTKAEMLLVRKWCLRHRRGS